LAGLLEHCAGFSDADQVREMEGFGYGTLRLQFDHVIGAERYWVGVLNGVVDVEEHESNRCSMEALRAFRERVTATTTGYLDGTTDEDLNRSRPLDTWNRKQVDLVPALVILRTQTHLFQHKGQIAAMCRLLGRPVPDGLDFPLAP
jgi:uncharacterized damage-inducible protein DinB